MNLVTAFCNDVDHITFKVCGDHTVDSWPERQRDSAVTERQLSLRDPLGDLYQLKCCPTVVQIMHTDPMSDPMSATDMFYLATCIACCSRLNYCAVSM